jgi:hypothetical protein
VLIVKLLIVASLFIAFIVLTIRLVRRGISKRYQPGVKTPWNSLTEGEDPTL